MMRVVLVLLVAAVAIGGGYYAFVMRARPPAAPAPEPAALFASNCNVENARYAMKGDPNVTLHFEVPMLERTGTLPKGFVYPPSFVIYAVTAESRTFRFAVAESVGLTTPYLFPMDDTGKVSGLRDADLIPMSLLGPQLEAIQALPRRGFTSPQHISAPGLARHLAQQIPPANIGADMFDFVACDSRVLLQPHGARASP